MCRHRCFYHEVDVPRCGRIPSRNAILKWVDDFNVCGSVVNKPVPQHVLIMHLRTMSEHSSTPSARHNAVTLQMSSSSFRSFSDGDLRFYPYKVHITQKVKEKDKASHVNFCRQLLDHVDNAEEVLDVLVSSDKTHFHLSGYLNRHNFSYWSSNNPM